MAVFPDKIVQKSSTDSVGSIIAQVSQAGAAPITGGELVIARNVGGAQLITLDSNGTPVIVGTEGTQGAGAPSVLINFEDPAQDSNYTYFADIPLSPSPKFGSLAYRSAASAVAPRRNPILINAADHYPLANKEWTLEFWIKVELSEWYDTPDTPEALPKSLLVWSHKDYLFGPGAFTISLDPGSTDMVNGRGTETSHSAGQAFGSIVFGLGGQYGTHGNPLVAPEGDVVSSRGVSVVDGSWHHVVFSHEGQGFYTCFIDGALIERVSLGQAIDHGEIGGSGISQPSGIVISGATVLNDQIASTEFHGFAGSLDSICLVPGVAKYLGASAIPVPTQPFDDSPVLTPSNTVQALLDTSLSLNVANGSILSYDAAEGLWKDVAAPSFDISGNTLDDIGDVNLVAAGAINDGEVLSWNSTSLSWENRQFSLDSLAGVDRTNTADKAVLVFNQNGNGFWEQTLLEYSSIQNRVVDLSDLGDITLTNLQDNDTLAYDLGANTWRNVSAPPVSISSNSIDELNDVQGWTDINEDPTVASKQNYVLAWDVSNQAYLPRRLSVSNGDIANISNRMSDLVVDIGISEFNNDAGYLNTISGQVIGSLSNVQQTSAQEGQMFVYRSGFWRNEFGPPANISLSSIGELSDVTRAQAASFLQADLTFEDMGSLYFDHPSQPTNIQFGFHYREVQQQIGFESIRTSDDTGSHVYVSRGYGVDMRSDVNVFRLRGRPDTTTNEPELRFETGDMDANVPTGNYISLKLPANVAENVTYVFPEEDGDVGDVLATNGSGELSWVSRVSNNTLGQLDDVDVTTQLPVTGSVLVYNSISGLWNVGSASTTLEDLSDTDLSVAPTGGQGLVYNATSGFWEPGNVSSVDLATSSITELSDVDTTTPAPTSGQGLVWNGSKWVPGDVSSVDLATSSIDELQDVDTSSAAPTDGQSLVYSSSTGKWIPGDSSPVFTSVSGGTFGSG